MIFIINKEPVGAVSLQSHLKQASRQPVEVYFSVEEVEANLYKLPDIILLDDSIPLTDFLYITQSIKAYDPGIQIIWTCLEDSFELQKMYRSYGVSCCLNKNEGLLERLSLSILEANQELNRSENAEKRRNQFRESISNSRPDSYSIF